MSEMNDQDKVKNETSPKRVAKSKKTPLNESWGAQKPTPLKEKHKKGK